LSTKQVQTTLISNYDCGNIMTSDNTQNLKEMDPQHFSCILNKCRPILIIFGNMNITWNHYDTRFGSHVPVV